MNLYHFTCDHGRQELGGKGALLPSIKLSGVPTMDPLANFVRSFVWVTSQPDGSGAGLTRRILACDRRAHRYRVIGQPNLTRWVDLTMPDQFRAELTDSTGMDDPSLPETWWVSTGPVMAVYDPILVGVTV